MPDVPGQLVMDGAPPRPAEPPRPPATPRDLRRQRDELARACASLLAAVDHDAGCASLDLFPGACDCRHAGIVRLARAAIEAADPDLLP